MAYKGKYRIKNSSKYKGDPTKIVYRSSWEYKFMKYCDFHKRIVEWSSEEIIIPYYSPVDGRKHRYFPDFWCKIKQANGELKEFLIEVKPLKETKPPLKKARVTPRYLREVETWGVNSAKWKAAGVVCERKGWEFKLLTEKELMRNGK
jgi:hypothetical protein